MFINLSAKSLPCTLMYQSVTLTHCRRNKINGNTVRTVVTVDHGQGWSSRS